MAQYPDADVMLRRFDEKVALLKKGELRELILAHAGGSNYYSSGNEIQQSEHNIYPVCKDQWGQINGALLNSTCVEKVTIGSLYGGYWKISSDSGNAKLFSHRLGKQVLLCDGSRTETERFFNSLNSVTSVKEIVMSACFYEGEVFQLLRNFFRRNALESIEVSFTRECFKPQYNPRILGSLANLIISKPDTHSLTQITIKECDMLCTCVQEMIPAFQQCPNLKKIDLSRNKIRIAGCKALARYLQNSQCSVEELKLSSNPIRKGSIALAYGLKSNKHLRILDFDDEHLKLPVAKAFCHFLCDKSSINKTFLSNHTVETIVPDRWGENGAESDKAYAGIDLYLKMNRNANKNQVAIRKILRYHPEFDMTPFDEEWEELEMLPHIMDWFERARNCPGVNVAHVDRKALDAVYQFATFRPLMFVPGPKIAKKKRQRVS